MCSSHLCFGNTGDEFPLDGGDVEAADVVNFEPNRRFTLRCPTGPNITLTTKSTVFWSSGAPGELTSTVIGIFHLPERRKTKSDLGSNRCFDISYGGSLLLTNCSQDGDVRYWCHVFPYDDVLHRSYVDVVSKFFVKNKLS